MIIGYIIFGGLLGAVSFVAALLLGASVWVGLLCYAGFGSISMFLLASMRVALDATQAEPTPFADPTEPTPNKDETSQPTMRILAVDDDPFILELLPIIAARNGFTEMTTAASAAAALTILTDDSDFDCLLVDINMPEMDGIELCRQVRSIPAYRSAPIIMLTAMRDMKNMGNAFRAGATDYATKPFDIAALGARLQLAQFEVTAARRSAGSSGTGHTWLNHPFDMPETQPFPGIESLIGRSKLVNYLTEISGTEISTIDVFALRSDPFYRIHEQASPQELDGFLAAVAAAAGTQFADDYLLMAYDGNGVFLIAAETRGRRDLSALERGIEEAVERWTVAIDAKGLPRAVISIGGPVRPKNVKAQRAVVAFGNAIALAEKRASDKGVDINDGVKANQSSLYGRNR